MAGARHYSELSAWRLARGLRREIYRLTERAPARRDFEFARQLRDAGRGPARNIAEGFGRFRPRDFSRFLSIASASLNETENHLEDGIDLGYWDREEAGEALALCRRTGAAIGGLQRYLSTCDPKFDTGRVPSPRTRTRTRTRTSRTRTEPREPKEPVEPVEPEDPE